MHTANNLRLLIALFTSGVSAINRQIQLSISTSCSYRLWMLTTACAALAFAVLCDPAGTVVRAADLAPGVLREARFKVGDKLVVLRFRGCPPGILVPGDPTKTDPHAPVPMDSFYIGQTEITFREIGDILGDKKRLAIVNGVNAVDSQGALKHLTSNPALPAFGVDFQDVIEFCRKLNVLSDSNSAGDLSDIETRRFRPPTHFEWQYACRAETTAKIKNPHFNGWPAGNRPHNDMDKNTQAKSLELWTALGNEKSSFIGTQDQIAQLCSRVETGEEKKPLEVLSVYLRRGGITRRNLFKVSPDDPLVLEPPGANAPNGWQINDMHDSVSEWTLATSDSERLAEFWNGIVNAEDISGSQKKKIMLFIAGGRFTKTMYPSGKTPRWNCFAIWGGGDQTIGIDNEPVNFDPATGEVIPLSMEELEEEAAHVLEDEMPGIRLVMVRALNDKWLRVVRLDVVRQNVQLDDLHNKFDLRKERMAKLVSQTRRKEMLAKLEHYRALAVYHAGQLEQAKQLIGRLSYDSPDAADNLYFSLVQQSIRTDEGPGSAELP